VWNNFFKNFIEKAGSHLDALAMHYYDTYQSGGSTDDDSDNYLCRTGSYLDALIDLQESHSLATVKKVLPQLVSEYGSGFQVKGLNYSPVHDWWVLRGVNGKMMQFMNRPDRFVKAIPFIVGKAIWHVKSDTETPTDSSTTPYPFTLWRNTKRQKSGKNKATDVWTETHLHKFYQFWEELPDGAQRFAVGSDNANVQVQGFRSVGAAAGSISTLFVAINNLQPFKAGHSPTKVDLSWLVEGIDGGSLKRLFFDRTTRTPTLTNARLDVVPQYISLMPEEMVLIKLEVLQSTQTWSKDVETVETYQSTQTVDKLDYTRPANGMPFPTLPTKVTGMVTARISIGGENKNWAAALAALNVEISGLPCTVKPEVQIAGETHVHPKDNSFLGALDIDCGTVDGPVELRVWSPREQVNDGLVFSSAVLVVKTR
jgi:hypothetical protein